ncbi:MAG: hypothetical protein ACFFCS_03935 [Candidatus Hodarchaeota archaeon]
MSANMCNDCRCNNEHLCSKKGYMREGMCCDKCVFYDETRECLKNQEKERQRILEELKTK